MQVNAIVRYIARKAGMLGQTEDGMARWVMLIVLDLVCMYLCMFVCMFCMHVLCMYECIMHACTYLHVCM